MLETQEVTPVEENKPIPEDINKYNKRIDDLIEDAEIEAEMEAEKKIRSKNSRIFSISLVGIAFLGLVYFQVKNQTVPAVEEAQIIRPKTAEERLAKQVPVLEGSSIAPNVATPVVPPQPKSVAHVSPKKTQTSPAKPKAPQVIKTNPIKKISQEIKSPKAKSVTPIKKVSQSPKASPKKISPTAKTTSSRFFIQVGAFGVEKNALALVKQLKAKGYAPSTQTRSQKLSQNIVTVGNFSNKIMGKAKLKELVRNGFDASIYKNSKNLFSLKMGQFNNIKDSQKLQDRLSLKGFISEAHQVDMPVKIYNVQLGVFPTREKAILVQEKLARSGYAKTFLR